MLESLAAQAGSSRVCVKILGFCGASFFRVSQRAPTGADTQIPGLRARLWAPTKREVALCR